MSSLKRMFTSKKRLVSTLTALVLLPASLLVATTPALAATTTVNCSTSGSFDVVDYVVVGQNGCQGDAAIPDGVIGINDYAFANSGVASAEIPASMLSIGNQAFEGATSLATVTFAANSNLTTIGTYAFHQTGLTTVQIPASVTSIGQGAFQENSSLTSASFEAGSQITGIGPALFYSSSITSFTLPSTVTEVGYLAFGNDYSLTSFNIPANSSLTTIDANAFQFDYQLTSINIPALVNQIGDYAFFANENLTQVTFAGNAPATVGYDAFADLGANPQALRHSNQTGFGPFGSNWNGLMVTGLPNQVEVDCYSVMMDNLYLLDPAGIEFDLYGCLNPDNQNPVADGTPYLVNSPGSFTFAPISGAPSAVYVVNGAPTLHGGSINQALTGTSFSNTTIVDAFSGAPPSLGSFELDPGSSLPAGVQLNTDGTLTASDVSAVSPGTYFITVDWIFSQGIANTYSARVNHAGAQISQFIAPATFVLNILSVQDKTNLDLFTSQLAAAKSSNSLSDWMAALATYKLLSSTLQNEFTGTEWISAEIAVEAYEADTITLADVNGAISNYQNSGNVDAALLQGLKDRVSNHEFAITTVHNGSQVTTTYRNPAQVQTFVVPDNVYQLTITTTGAEGSQGGTDASGRPPTAGYKGVVTGTISVTPGQILTIGVGGRGIESINAPYCSGGVAAGSGDPSVAVGGTNPLGGYAGGYGGSPAPNGCSGYGGSGGAASVVEIGDSTNPTSTGVIVAGGSGGSGGSGQFTPTLGQISLSTFAPRLDATSTNGQDGIYSYVRCIETNSNNCDGGGGAGGGGGAQGGVQGAVEFGAGSSNEWFGLGAAPGQNSTAGLAGLAAGYNYYTFDTGFNHDGSVVISYSDGTSAAPTGVSGNAQNNAVNVYWSAPTLTGAGQITGYAVEYSTDQTNWTVASNCTSAQTSCLVSGLTNGVAYYFAVSATNSVGTSAWSNTSQAVTPSGPPAAPTINAMTAGDGSLTVTFAAPASGTPIFNYEYSLNNGAWISGATAASPLVIVGLNNGTVYAVRVRAVNAAGAGDSSQASNQTPTALPGAPTITSLTPGSNGTSLSVTFVPGYNGGSSITGYEYAVSLGANTSNFGSYVAVGSTQSPFVISGLQNGTTYTVSLRAINSLGAGPSSVYQTGVTLSRPNAPQFSAVTSGDSRATVRYVAYTLSTNGGSAISKIEYSLDNGVTWVDSGTLSNPFAITGLTNGTTYNLKLRATNAIGLSSASAVSTFTPIVAPSQPQNVIVLSGAAGLTVAWASPRSIGGSSVAGYTATAFSDINATTAVASCTTSGASCQLSGLTNGVTYYVAVIANNSAGAGLASAVVPGVPVALPDAPIINANTPGSSRVSIDFTPGASDANAPITGYQYSIDGGSTWTNASASSSPMQISNLQNGTTYQVELRAISAFGAGAASQVVSAVPFTNPSVVDPTSISYVASHGAVTISWDAAVDNGSAISNYTVTLFDSLLSGSTVNTCSTTGALSCTIGGLSDGQTYYVSIQSLNAAGYSLRSSPRVAVRPGTTSTIALTSSSVDLHAGDSITLTATLNSDATGTVNFTSNGSSITGCSAVAVSSGQAVCTTTSLSVRVQQIQASYSGSSTYASAVSSALSVNVHLLAQSISFAAISNKLLSLGTVQLTATGGVSGNPVTFTSNTQNVCSTSGTNGATIVLLSAGRCSIAADQAGTPNYDPATQVVRSFNVLNTYTWSFAGNGGTSATDSSVYVDGDSPLTLPNATRESYVFDGWFTDANSGTLVGLANDPETPVADRTLYAHWTQLSLAGMGSATRIGSITTTSGIGNSFTADGSNNSVRISYGADALPASSTVDVYLLANSSRAQSLISSERAFLVSLVVAWRAPDGTVPVTASGKPITMVITNPGIRAGSAIYSVLGTTVTQLGTATQDGQATITLTQDPEIVIAAAAPAAPIAASAVVSGSSATVSWTAPVNDGGSVITGYTVTANDGQTCTATTLSCTFSNLTAGASYTFTVVASNTVGASAASAATTSVTIPAAQTPSAPTPVAPVVPVVSAPTTVSETPGAVGVSLSGRNLTVSWSVPAGASAAGITGYVVGTNHSLGCTTTTTSCTLNGLVPGLSYVISVVAINAIGSSMQAAPPSGSVLIAKSLSLGSFSKVAALPKAVIASISRAASGATRPIQVQLLVAANPSKTNAAVVSALVKAQLAAINSQLRSKKLTAKAKATAKIVTTAGAAAAATATVVLK